MGSKNHQHICGLLLLYWNKDAGDRMIFGIRSYFVILLKAVGLRATKFDCVLLYQIIMHRPKARTKIWINAAAWCSSSTTWVMTSQLYVVYRGMKNLKVHLSNVVPFSVVSGSVAVLTPSYHRLLSIYARRKRTSIPFCRPGFFGGPFPGVLDSLSYVIFATFYESMWRCFWRCTELINHMKSPFGG